MKMRTGTRIHDLYMCILHNPMTLGELSSELGLSHNTVSDTMSYMRENDLIIYRTQDSRYWCKEYEFIKTQSELVEATLLENQGKWMRAFEIIAQTDCCNADHVHRTIERLIRDGVDVQIRKMGPRKYRHYRIA